MRHTLGMWHRIFAARLRTHLCLQLLHRAHGNKPLPLAIALLPLGLLEAPYLILPSFVFYRFSSLYPVPQSPSSPHIPSSPRSRSPWHVLHFPLNPPFISPHANPDANADDAVPLLPLSHSHLSSLVLSSVSDPPLRD
jgi:hypothetical protein